MTPKPDDDFDAFLSSAMEGERNMSDGEAFMAKLDSEMYQALPYYAIYPLSDHDEQRAAAHATMTTDVYIAVNEDRLREAYRNQFDTEDEFQAFLMSQATDTVKREHMHEVAILARVGMLLGGYEFDSRRLTTEAELLLAKDVLEETKKKLIAELIVEGIIDARGGWIQFLNDFIPGEALDPSDESAEEYFAEALEHYVYRSEKTEGIQRTAAELRELLASSTDFVHRNNDPSTTTTDLMLAAMFERQLSARDAALDEVARRVGIDGANLVLVKGILVEIYPLEV